MSKIRNLSIATRLLLGFLTLTFFTISIGLLALWNSNQYINTTDMIFEHPYKISNTVQEIETRIVSIHRSMKDVALAENRLELEKAIHAVNNNENEINKLFSIVSEYFLGDTKDVSAAWNSFKEWKSIRSEVIVLRQIGDKKAAAIITKGKGAIYVESLNSKIKKMKEFAHQKAEDFHLSAHTQGDNTFKLVIISLLIATILSLLIAIAITQSIKRPIKRMNMVSKSVQEGNLSARNMITSKDELDILALGINSMTDVLNSKITIQNGISTLTESLIGATDTHQFALKLLENLILVSQSNSGRFYILGDDKVSFNCIASISANNKHLKMFTVKEAPGEFGSVILKKQMQIVKNLKQEPRFDFTTSIGNYSPKEILTFPIITDGIIQALISLSNLDMYSDDNVEILRFSSLNINTSFSNILSSQKTKVLAETLSQSNQTLELQSEELKEQTQELHNQTIELNEQNRSLSLKTQEVELANQLKSEFLSNMSHELRTPLNSIMALSRTLIKQASTKLDDDENAYLEIVERNGRNLLKLINDILDLSKIEAGKMDIYPQTLQVESLLNILIENLSPLAFEKNIQLELNLTDKLPLIETDEIRLNQILTNLINNAIKFTDKGKVSITSWCKDDNIKIEIQDTGIGISNEHIKTIFDEFRQIDGSSSRRYEGTGLGLAIVKKLLIKLGGQIDVSSKPSIGTNFTISIPIVWHKAKLTSPFILSSFTKSAHKKLESKDSQKFIKTTDARILIIEDNKSAIIQMTQVLEHNGYIVDIAVGGKEAYNYMGNQIPDGIILDLMMPEIDGFEVLETIRNKKSTSEIPVVILTAKDLTNDDLIRLSENNIHQLIQKGDIDIEALLDIVRSMVEKSEVSNKAMQNLIQIPKIELKDGKKAKVLIIEDNMDNMVTIKSILGKNYDIFEAYDGELGLNMVHQIQPDLVLLDMALPKIDGIEVVKFLKHNVLTQQIPVIALTARAMMEDKAEILEAGCDEYVTKPVDHSEILNKIESFFL